KKDIWDTVEVTGEVHGYPEAKVFSVMPGKVHSKVKATGSRVEKNEPIIEIDRDEPAMEFSLVKVKSPLKGIITRYFVNEGETVFPSFPLAEIASIERVKINVQISEKDFSKVQNGLDAIFYVDTYPNAKYKGKLANLNQSLDEMSRTISADIVAPNIGYQLKPGMFAKVEIFAKKHQNALIIPQEAVMYNPGSENTVFVINNDGLASLRTVKLGLQTKGYVQVLSGVNEGEDVITVGQFNIKEGLKVKVSE
ncbi:MAG: efflux RND transporter periplasmic adaptor subunit, partial [Elusimicrobia bacterium]|nr:efflux RND transporter periplasmic adaptor subunit [Elusimicrobiota bacterium]